MSITTSSNPSLLKSKQIESASLDNLSKLTSSVDFIAALSTADLDKPTREKLTLLHSYGKSFEKGYYHQCELTTKLQSHLEFKEREYLQQEQENKELKERIKEQKLEIRRLEDSALQLMQQRDKYKIKCKKLQATLKGLGQHISAKQIQSSKDGSPFESSRTHVSNRDNQDSEDFINKNNQESQPSTFSTAVTNLKYKSNLPQSLEPIREIPKEYEHQDSVLTKKELKLNLIQIPEHHGMNHQDENEKNNEHNNDLKFETLEDVDEREELDSPDMIKNLKEAKKVKVIRRSPFGQMDPKIMFLDNRIEKASSQFELQLQGVNSLKPSVRKNNRAATLLSIDEKRMANLKKSIVTIARPSARKITETKVGGSLVFNFDERSVLQRKTLDPRQPHLQKKNDSQPNNLKFFEEFFIIGIQKSDIEQFEKENPGVAFPKNSYDDNSNCFVFPLLGGELNENAEEGPEILMELNPDRLLYHICIKTNDFIDFGYIEENLQATLETKQSKPNKKKKVRKIWKVSKVYCFMTFLPLIKLFMDINCKILNVLKIERMTLFSKLISENKDALEKMDDKWANEFVENELVKYLEAIFQYPLPILGSFFEFKYKDYDRINTYIGEKNQAGNQALSWAYPTVFTYFTLKDLWLIYSVLINERKLVIMSKNLALLSSTLLVLHAMLRPFKYTYPMIFNLPEVLLDLFGAPGSGLFGSNQGLEFLEKEELNAIYSDCVFVVLGEHKPLMILEQDMLQSIVQPTFRGMEAKIAPHYAYFNKSTTSNIHIYNSTQEIDHKIKAEFISDYGVREIHSRRFSALNSKGAEIEHSLQILKIIQRALTKNIINLIPDKPIFSSEEPEELDYKGIGAQVVERNPDERPFLKEFVTTQMFTYFIERKYEELTNR